MYAHLYAKLTIITFQIQKSSWHNYIVVVINITLILCWQSPFIYTGGRWGKRERERDWERERHPLRTKSRTHTATMQPEWVSCLPTTWLLVLRPTSHTKTGGYWKKALRRLKGHHAGQSVYLRTHHGPVYMSLMQMHYYHHPPETTLQCNRSY